MLKQQTVSTAMGELTVSSLTLGELRQLDALFNDKSESSQGITAMLRFVPVLHKSVVKVHQDVTPEQLESGLTFEDFNALFTAVLVVSGLKKATEGESKPAQAA